MDVHVPETQDFSEAALVPIMTAVSVGSDLGRGVVEDMSVSSQGLPVNPEPEEHVTHKEAVHISATRHETLEVNVPVTVETEPEVRSTSPTSEDKVSTLEVEEQALLSPESGDSTNIELNNDIIPLSAAEPEPKVVAAVVTPVLGTSELQAEHSVEETTEVSFTLIPLAGSLVNCNKIIKEVHIAEAASGTEFIPNEGRFRFGNGSASN